MIYFDQAASSWPKPKGVAEAMAEAVLEYGANPGRGGHRLAVRAAEVVGQTRTKLAKLFGIKRPSDLIFFNNATSALNQAIKGFDWKEGDHVLATMFEHNAVRRPLAYLRDRYGVQVTLLKPDHNGCVDLAKVRQAIHRQTKLIVATHMSNVTGAILPIREIGRIAHELDIPFLVDASQSAGILPIDVEEDHIDLLAFPGHKGLYGPQGTGGLYIAPHLDLIPLCHGGTGSFSELEVQPEQRPERYESGTLNTPGLAGLKVGVSFVLETGVNEIKRKEEQLTRYALEGLQTIEGIRLYGPDADVERGPVISFNLKGISPHELAAILDQYYHIATRAGLHCAPLAHQSIQTEREGTVRISFGYFNHQEEIDQLISALQEIKAGWSAL
jgi:cysteine desulfurase family protein